MYEKTDVNRDQHAEEKRNGEEGGPAMIRQATHHACKLYRAQDKADHDVNYLERFQAVQDEIVLP